MGHKDHLVSTIGPNLSSYSLDIVELDHLRGSLLGLKVGEYPLDSILALQGDHSQEPKEGPQTEDPVGDVVPFSVTAELVLGLQYLGLKASESLH